MVDLLPDIVTQGPAESKCLMFERVAVTLWALGLIFPMLLLGGLSLDL